MRDSFEPASPSKPKIVGWCLEFYLKFECKFWCNYFVNRIPSCKNRVARMSLSHSCDSFEPASPFKPKIVGWCLEYYLKFESKFSCNYFVNPIPSTYQVHADKALCFMSTNHAVLQVLLASTQGGTFPSL